MVEIRILAFNAHNGMSNTDACFAAAADLSCHAVFISEPLSLREA